MNTKEFINNNLILMNIIHQHVQLLLFTHSPVRKLLMYILFITNIFKVSMLNDEA